MVISCSRWSCGEAERGEIFPKREFRVKNHLNVTKTVLPTASRRRAAEQLGSFLSGLLLVVWVFRNLLEVSRWTGALIAARRTYRSGPDRTAGDAAARRGSARSSHRPGPPAGRRRDTFTEPNRCSFLLEICKYEVSVDQHHSDIRGHEGEQNEDIQTWTSRKD